MNESMKIACKEVLDLLDHTRIEDVNRIPKKFMNFLKENASATYVPNIDYTKNIMEFDLKPKTVDLMGVIYRQFWCNEEQKKEFDMTLMENERKREEEARKKYDIDVFKNRKNNNA